MLWCNKPVGLQSWFKRNTSVGKGAVLGGSFASSSPDLAPPKKSWSQKLSADSQPADIAKQSGLRHFTVHMDTGFLSNRPQKVRIGRSHIFHTHPEHWHTTGVCSQPPPLLPFHQWLFPHSSYKYHVQVCCHQITTIVGLISDNSETAYREEIKHFTEWSSNNNLDLNVKKNKEKKWDFRKSKRTEHSALFKHGEEVKRR